MVRTERRLEFTVKHSRGRPARCPKAAVVLMPVIVKINKIISRIEKVEVT